MQDKKEKSVKCKAEGWGDEIGECKWDREKEGENKKKKCVKWWWGKEKRGREERRQGSK